MREFQPVKQYESEREAGISIVYVSIMAAIGVNMIVSGIALLIDRRLSCVFILLGIIITILSLFLYWHNRNKALKRNNTYKGFFIYDSEKKDIIYIPRYEIVEHMWLHMVSAYRENKEITDAWKNGTIGQFQYDNSKGFHIVHIESESENLFKELLEYCVIQILSVHLMDYFCNYEEEEITKIERSNIPDGLQENRFLNWLSEEKGDWEKYREVLFSETPIEEKLENIVEATPEGSFERFEMYMPKRAKLLKTNNSIIISHPSFEFRITFRFDCTGALLPLNFKRWYLGLDDDHGRYKDFEFSGNTAVRFKWWTLFLKRQMKYYNWIDSFLERLKEFMSQEYFFEEIGWKTAETVNQCQINIMKKNMKQ